MAVYNGTDVLVYVQGTLVAASQSCTLDMSMDVFETTSKDSGGKREIKPGKTQWSISGDYLDSVGSSNYEFTDFATIMNARTLVSVRVDNSGLATGKYYTGQGYLVACNQTSNKEEAVTGSFTIEGTSGLSIQTHT